MLSMWLRRISPGIFLFLFFFSIYTFTMSGSINYGDEIEKYRVAQSIVERGEFSFRPTDQRNVVGAGGRTVSGYELGQTLVQVPFYALGKLAYTLFPVSDSNSLTMLIVGLHNPLVSALTIVLLFKTGAMLGFHFKTAFGLSIVFGLATIAFPYSRSFTREPLLTLLLLLPLFTSFQFSKTYANRWLFLTGLAVGYLAFTKFIHGVVIPVFLLYIAFVIFQREQQRGADRARTWIAILQGVVVVLLPGIVLLMVQSIYAFARFGSFTSGLGGLPANPINVIIQLLPFATPVEATLGLLFSIDKSIFLYSPPIVLGFLGWRRWFRFQPRDALFVLALVLIEFVPVTMRYDWHGGSWWGPRYLVQITPLLILTVGFLFSASDDSTNRKWARILSGLAVIGFLIQLVGALVNDRDYLDATGTGSTFLGQIGFLTRGAIDSLVLYLSPDGFPVRINPFGPVLIAVILFLAWLIAMRWQQGETTQSSWASGVFLAVVLLIESIGFVIWLVAPYSQVIAAKGDTRYVVANNLVASGKQCEAIAFYSKALELGTNHAPAAAEQIVRMNPPVLGKLIAITHPSFWIDSDGETMFEADSVETITGNGSLRFAALPETDASILVTSEPLPATPNTAFELSGWVKSLAIYGAGYGVVSIFEDNGDWGNGRTTDIKGIDETSGWQLFRKTITTLPTTKRLFVKMGLYKTYGTLWVDGIQLVQVDTNAPNPKPALPPCK